MLEEALALSALSVLVAGCCSPMDVLFEAGFVAWLGGAIGGGMTTRSEGAGVAEDGRGVGVAIAFFEEASLDIADVEAKAGE